MSEIGYGPLERVDGPPPAAPMFGLLQAALAPAGGVRLIENEGDRWMNGVQVFPYPSDTGDVYNPCAPGSEAVPKGDGPDDDNPKFGAMTAYVAETCTSYKIWDQNEYKARALAALYAVESGIVAHEFMHGSRFPGQPYLADGNGTFPNGDTVTSVVNGLAYLEQAIAQTRRQGLIHCSPQLVTAFRERFAVDNTTGVIRTINGTVVIPDAGYADSSRPTGHAAATGTQEWIYATGPVDVRRTEEFVMPPNVSQALQRGTGGAETNPPKPNSITYRAERYYLVDWDTILQAAVLVDRCQSTCDPADE